MPSQFRETYLYYAGNKEVKSIRISGINKKDTDEKFTAFLIDFNTFILTSTSCLIWEIKSLEISRWKTSSACLIH